MRSMLTMVALSSAVLLSACGGGTGVETVGSVAPPSGSGSSPTPTSTHSFVAPTESKTYEAIGAVQHYQYYTDSNGGAQGGQLYAGDANTVRDSGISLTYDPRDAIFELTIARPKGLVDVPAFRFQDPAHRTDFGGAAQPQAGVAQFATSRQIQYLESGSASGSRLDLDDPLDPTDSFDPYANQGYGANDSDYVVGAKGYTSTTQTFFYQKPGTTTKYVTYAGYVRNTVSATEEQPDPAFPPFLRETYSFDRAAFVYGERTANASVPVAGTGTYSGEMIATIVFNPMIDTDAGYPTYFQWMEGNQTTKIDFASLGVTSTFTGTVFAPTFDAYTSRASVLPAGSTFSATAGATIDLVNRGGFTGSFSSAKFVRPGMTDFNLVIAGSSLDGAFFGPNGEEIGGGFRIVGGTPDERIDILGAFTGKK